MKIQNSECQFLSHNFEVIGDCTPCQYVEDIRPGLMHAMDGRRGTLCRVVNGGTIRVNDAVKRNA